MRVNRDDHRLIPSVLAGLLVVLVGCNAATTSGRIGPDAVYQAPEYPTLKLESLAYVGMATLVQDPTVISIADDLVRSYLVGGQQKFVIVDAATAHTRAIAAGAEGDLNSMVQAWRNNHSVDRLSVQALGKKLGFDGFVFADLTQWREEQVDWTSEGHSFTEVGMTLSVYGTANGLLAWKGEKMERRESLHYDRGDGAGTGVYREGSGTVRTERADKIAPTPPPAEEVAESVVQHLISGLPSPPGGTSKQ